MLHLIPVYKYIKIHLIVIQMRLAKKIIYVTYNLSYDIPNNKYSDPHWLSNE